MYKTLTHILRGQGKKVISVAWTGIASILLLEGRTVHNVFQIPLDLTPDSTSSIALHTDKAKQLESCNVFIWDEAPMATDDAVNAIDKLLKKIMKNDLPFGGKVFVMGGDFRQTAVVIPKANIQKICEKSIKRRVREQFETIKLKINMRTGSNEIEFAKWLLKIGDNTEKNYPELGEDLIKLPNECIIQGKKSTYYFINKRKLKII